MEISELMFNIRKFDLVLPEFQREYVWGLEQSKQLIVSLFRGFPTGSLLFWKTDKPPEVKNTTIAPDKIGATLVILDGQQRLTTLYLFTQNEIPPYYRQGDIRYDPRDLYFDLDSGDFQYYQVTRMHNNPAWVAVTDCFAGNVDPVDIVAQKVSEGGDFGQLAKRYYSNFNRLIGTKQHAYPIQIVPATATIDDAIDVFDRVNSLGTPLSEAELALAHITGKWPQARQVMKDKIAELATQNFSFDLTFMVRCLTGVVKQRALFETIHQSTAEEIKPGWELLSSILDYLITVLARHANIHSTDDLNTTNVLVPAVVYLAKHNIKFDNDREMRYFIHWMYAASIWARYSSQTNQKLDYDIAIIQRHESPWRGLVDAIIDQRGRIEVTPSDLEGRSRRHPLFRMIYVLAKSQGAVDLFDGVHLDLRAKSHGIHSRPIFPGSYLYSEEGGYSSDNHLHKKIVNEIANFAFLGSSKNDTPMGSALPASYLPEVMRKYPGALERQFIPTAPALWELNRYEDFLAARRKLIAKTINERMAELISLPTSKPQTLDDMLTGENAILEYKSSMRYDMRTKQVNKELEKMIAKTVAGFLNSEGGTLLIGVADDCTVLGLTYDMKTLGRKDRDGYEQKLLEILTEALGAEFSQYQHISFEEKEGKTVCIVRVDQSPEPVYLMDKDNVEFYVRVGNTTRPLDIQAAHDYISMHWQA